MYTGVKHILKTTKCTHRPYDKTAQKVYKTEIIVGNDSQKQRKAAEFVHSMHLCTFSSGQMCI